MRRTIQNLLALLMLAAAWPASAQAYPSKAITIYVGYAPGGPTDTFARTLGAFMTDKLGQPVIVDNRPGAAGQLAVAAVKRAPADGYALYFGDLPTLATNTALFPDLSYQPQKDLHAITEVAILPGLLLVPASSPYKTFEDFAVALRAGNRTTYASQGVGSGAHLLSTLLVKRLRAEAVHVPYRGSAPGLMALMSSEIDWFYDTTLANPYVATGKLRVLAVGHDQRLAQYPNAPTLKELGYGDIVPTFWYGMTAKAGTSREAVDAIDRTLKAAVRDPTVVKRFAEIGVVLTASTSPEQFRKYIDAETEKWGRVIKENGIKGE